MSEQKPKKDLRARLGRTISPQTPGAPPIAAPAGVIAPPAAAPAAAAPKAASSPGQVAAPPAVVAPPAITPPAAAPAAKAPFGTDIAPPPFARPAEPPKPERKRPDPFAAAPVVQQEVRIAVDDRPVDDSEVGRRQTGRVLIVIAAGLAIGAALGAGVGTMNARRVLYNTTVRDGHAIYASVDSASRVVMDAQSHIEALATSAGGGLTGHPTVNYAEIEALVGLPEPLHAEAFSQKNYNAFQPGAVDDLFTYYNNIQELWRQFHHLSMITAGPEARPSVDAFAAVAVCPVSLGHDSASARAAIQAAADATATAASAQYVAALTTGPDGNVHGALRFAEPELGADGNPTGHILMHAAPGEAGTAVELFTAETPLTAEPTHAIVINGGNSAGVLSERLGSFRSFVQALQETRTLMTTTIEVQGRLTTSLGDIARLEEVAAF
jgi:hypothetical protein